MVRNCKLNHSEYLSKSHPDFLDGTFLMLYRTEIEVYETESFTDYATTRTTEWM